jgi:hypothetical protein
MTIHALQSEIRALTQLEPSGEPVLSWYLDLHDEAGMEQSLYQGLVQPRLAMSLETRRLADAALQQARSHLQAGLPAGTRSVALFSRAGARPFLRAIPFRIAAPSIASLGPSPRIYPLAEIADNYHRFALLCLEGGAARLFRVELGAVTAEYPLPSLEVPKNAGRARLRRVDIARDSVAQALETLPERMQADGLDHWVLAADPWSSEAVEPRLPHALKTRLYGSLSTRPGELLPRVALRAAEEYRRGEEIESRQYARQVWLESSRGGMAVSGRQASRSALLARQAETLVLLSRRSARFHLNPELRDELVHLAQHADCHVEFVDDSPPLAQLGGMGCLLRA